MQSHAEGANDCEGARRQLRKRHDREWKDNSVSLICARSLAERCRVESRKRRRFPRRISHRCESEICRLAMNHAKQRTLRLMLVASLRAPSHGANAGTRTMLPKLERRPELDALRGLFLVWMTLTHLPTRFSDFVNQPIGFVSSAEGFVFISALLVGRLYIREFVQNPGERAREAVEALAEDLRLSPADAWRLPSRWWRRSRFTRIRPR